MLDKLTSWWRVSYCAARIRALACLGFWPWFVWAGVTINATIGEPLDVHPPFGEDEAEIVGVYETPNSSRKWIYTSDGTLEAKRESDDSYSPNFFWLPKEYRGDDYEGQRRWTVNKEGYVEYYLKKPLYYSKWIIDEDAPSMKILPNGDMLESESTYMNVLLGERTWKRIARPHPIIRALDKEFIPRDGRRDIVFSLVAPRGFNGWAALFLSLLGLILVYEILIDLGKIKDHFGWFERIIQGLKENCIFWIALFTLFVLFFPVPDDYHWIWKPFVFFFIISGIACLFGLPMFWMRVWDVHFTSLNAVLVIVLFFALFRPVEPMQAVYYFFGAFVIREAIVISCLGEPSERGNKNIFFNPKTRRTEGFDGGLGDSGSDDGE